MLYAVDLSKCRKSRLRPSDRCHDFVQFIQIPLKIHFLEHGPCLFLGGKPRAPPKVVTITKAELHIDYTDSQLPASEDYLYVDPEYPEVYPS